MKYEKPEATLANNKHNYEFNYKLMDEWVLEHIQSQQIEGKGSDRWKHLFV